MIARHVLRGSVQSSQFIRSSRVCSYLPISTCSYTPLTQYRSRTWPDKQSPQRAIPLTFSALSRPFHSSAIARFSDKQDPAEVGKNSPNKGDPLVNKSSIPTSEYQPQHLSEDILTIPNVLTMLRLASTPVLGYLILIDEMPYALGLLAVSGFTDVLDGWLARKFKSATVFGSIADPAADKALMTVMVGALVWRGLIPLPLVLLIVGRDVALVISAFLIRYRSLPEPRTFSRYWDPRLPSAKVEPTQVSKYNTFLQIILVAGCTLIASFNENWRQWWNEKQGLWNDKKEVAGENREEKLSKQDWGDLAKKSWHAFMIVVSITTVWSGSSYLFGSNAVKYLGQKAKVSRDKMLKVGK